MKEVAGWRKVFKKKARRPWNRSSMTNGQVFYEVKTTTTTTTTGPLH